MLSLQLGIIYVLRYNVTSYIFNVNTLSDVMEYLFSYFGATRDAPTPLIILDLPK